MNCDGPEHMDEQEIVALITGDNQKEADEAVEDKIGVSAKKRKSSSKQISIFTFFFKEILI